MKELVTEIVKALVDKPEHVSVAEIEGDHISVLEVRVAKSDTDLIIGLDAICRSGQCTKRRLARSAVLSEDQHPAKFSFNALSTKQSR